MTSTYRNRMSFSRTFKNLRVAGFIGGLAGASLVAMTGAAHAAPTACIVDVALVATNSGARPQPLLPDGDIGYWDVDSSGGAGTEGERGAFMMGLSVKRGTSDCLEDVRVIASNSNKPEDAPEGYQLVGYWDVDNSGGASADDASKGAFMMGLYKKKAWTPPGVTQRVLTDLHLTASSKRDPASTKPGYQRVGYWDVDRSGGVGTDGSRGNWMMTLQRRKSDYTAPSVPVGAPRGYWLSRSSGGQTTNIAAEESLDIGHLNKSLWSRETRKHVSATISAGVNFLVGSAQVSVTAGGEKSSTTAGEIVGSRDAGYKQSCSVSVDTSKGDIHTIWQWAVSAPVGGAEVTIKTCHITCTPTGDMPTYTPDSPEAKNACWRKTPTAPPAESSEEEEDESDDSDREDLEEEFCEDEDA